MEFSTTTAATVFTSVTSEVIDMIAWGLPYIVGFVLSVGLVFWVYRVVMSRALR